MNAVGVSAVGAPAAQQPRCGGCARRAAWIAMVTNGALGGFKLFTGLVADSAAVTVDGIQSLACFLVSVLVAMSLRVSSRQADTSHPFGYGKVEHLVSAASSAGLFGLGLSVMASSVYLLGVGRSQPPGLIALPVAVISILTNQQLAALCRCAGNAVGSAGLLANAAQNRADMVSSWAVAISVALSLLGPGWYFFDALGAGVAALFIMVEAAEHWRADLRVLLDRGVPPALLERAHQEARQLAGSPGARYVAGRRSGARVDLDIGLELSRHATVQQAQQASSRLRQRLLHQLSQVRDVRVFPHAAAHCTCSQCAEGAPLSAPSPGSAP